MSRLTSILAVVCLLFSWPVFAETAVPQSREQITLSFAPLVKETAPAVVNIFTRKVVRERQVSPLFSDPFFQRFFGNQLGLGGQTREREQNSLGSGVLVDAGGLIITNNHVIEGADEIRVVLTDRREFAATVVGVDDRTDLAVLSVESDEPLPFLSFRNSDELEVGDLVLAIGNPFGVGQTVTSGIVSGVARTQVGVADIGSFIQTDAAINPGNSGGALIGMDGRLVGINTAIFSKTGGSLGIGFAVPSNMVRFVIDNIVNGGKVVRPWLGAFGQPVTSEMAEALGLDRPQGVIIDHVWAKSAAASAGLQQGDIVMAVEGRAVNTPQELAFRIGSRAVGGEALISVIRGQEHLDVPVALMAAPEDPPRDVRVLEGRHPLAGAVVANVSPALFEQERLDSLDPGVVILKYARGSPAERLRLQRGDYVLAINGRAVKSVAELVEVIDAHTGDWDIVFRREGQQIRVRLNG